MMNLYGGQGMGTAGGGINPGGQISPQLLALMAQPNMATPMQQGGGSTPMSGYITPQMGGGMSHPQMAMPQSNPAAQQQQGQQQAQGGMNQNLMQLMAAMKQGQGGVTPPAQATANTPGLVWNPSNLVGTSTLGGATANPYPAASGDQSGGMGGLLASLMSRFGGGGAGG